MFYASIDVEDPEGSEPVPMFDYFLADRLGRTLAELGDMPHTEYVGWVSFHKVRQQQEELAFLRAKHA